MTFDGIYLQRFIIILLVIFIILSVIRKMGKFACFCISILCFMQIGYMLGNMPEVNEKFPFSDYFKYDVVKSITSIWNETDKEALKQNISDGINTGADMTEDAIDFGVGKTQEIVDKYKEYKANGGIIPETSPTPEPEITEIPTIESTEENPVNSNS